jgi:hypothetical protein
MTEYEQALKRIQQSGVIVHRDPDRRCCICDAPMRPHEARYPYDDGAIAHPKCAHDECFDKPTEKL